jgi:CheY-like chemotaxis protein
MSNDEPVLIIDDSIDDADFASIILREAGVNNIIHATNLSDAVNLLKNGDIKRVVLDLGGIVKGSNNPMATLDALEEEGIKDLQVIVLTGNKNPAIRQQVESRGYQCLTKDSALDIVESSTLLPEAIARLQPSYHHADLEQNMLLRELFVKYEVMEGRVVRIELQIDRVLLALAQTDTTGVPEMKLNFRYLDTRVTHIEVLRNQFGEVSVRQDFFQQQLAEIKTNSTNYTTNLQSVLEDVKHLKSLAEENQWLITSSRHVKNIGLFLLSKVREGVIKYIKLIVITVLAGVLASSPAWFPIIKQMPDLQRMLKWAIENIKE